MILTAFIFLVLGLVELIIVQIAIYPALRWRYEKAKTTASQGMDPSRIMALVKIQCLVLMPLLGYVVGSYFQKPAG